MRTVRLTDDQLDDVAMIYRDLVNAPSDTYEPDDIGRWHIILAVHACGDEQRARAFADRTHATVAHGGALMTCPYCPMPNGAHHTGCCMLSPLGRGSERSATESASADSQSLPRSFHMAQSVDADRFTDAYLRKHVLPSMTHEGKPVTVKQFRKACADARAKGLDVFPPCDNVDEKGNCRGHEEGAPSK
jgi:hypothetical protein